jgi:hypothetical protein
VPHARTHAQTHTHNTHTHTHTRTHICITCTHQSGTFKLEKSLRRTRSSPSTQGTVDVPREGESCPRSESSNSCLLLAWHLTFHRVYVFSVHQQHTAQRLKRTRSSPSTRSTVVVPREGETCPRSFGESSNSCLLLAWHLTFHRVYVFSVHQQHTAQCLSRTRSSPLAPIIMILLRDPIHHLLILTRDFPRNGLTRPCHPGMVFIGLTLLVVLFTSMAPALFGAATSTEICGIFV